MSAELFQNFADVLEYRAREEGTRLAFRFLGDGESIAAEWTYADLDSKARIIGQFLTDHGASGQRVLLIYPAGLEYIAALFGCFYAGAVAVPAYPPRQNHNLERLQSIQQDCNACLVLTTAEIMDHLSLRDGHDLPSGTPFFAHETLRGAKEWQRSVTADSLALLQYTSASTGHPKGVKITHQNLLHNSGILKRGFCYGEESACVSWLPAYHDMGLVGGILQPVYGGFPCTLFSPIHFLQRPIRWLEAISRFQATISGGPNFAYALCVRRRQGESAGSIDLSKWSVAFNGSEPISVHTMRQFTDAFADCGFSSKAFFPCYGLAEGTLIVSGGPIGRGPFIRKVNAEYLPSSNGKNGHQRKGAMLASSGQVLDGVEVRIVDPESLTLCGPNQVGEIWIRSESVGDGYWRAPDQTSAVFQARLPDSDGNSFLRSGDLGLLYEKQLFVTGRVKDLIIIRGSNHYPQDIEFTVQQSHPAFACRLGAAFSIPTTEEEVLVMVQEVERHREAEIEDAVSGARQNVATMHGLRISVFMVVQQGTIPKTTSGKIQRWAVKDAFRNQTLPCIAEWTS